MTQNHSPMPHISTLKEDSETKPHSRSFAPPKIDLSHNLSEQGNCYPEIHVDESDATDDDDERVDSSSSANSPCHDYRHHLPLRTAPLTIEKWASDSPGATPDDSTLPPRCQSAPIPETDVVLRVGDLIWHDPTNHSPAGWAVEKVEEVDFIREEFMHILEKRRADADVSLCKRMMEEMAAREELELEVEKLLGPWRSMRRRRSIG